MLKIQVRTNKQKITGKSKSCKYIFVATIRKNHSILKKKVIQCLGNQQTNKKLILTLLIKYLDRIELISSEGINIFMQQKHNFDQCLRRIFLH